MRAPKDNVTAFLTSAEAAALLGVSASTVKRWVDDGTLQSERTLGGHRRIRREAVAALQGRGLESGAPDARRAAGPDDLLELLLSAHSSRELEGRLIALRAAAESVGAFGDALVPPLQEMGARWARGELSIAAEHMATERLTRALARLAEWAPVALGAPIAILATAVEDEHTLGLSLAELCLREMGWDARWVGRRTPTAALVDAIVGTEVRLVALSASVVSSDARSLASQARLIAAACAEAGATLLLGGDGAWPERPKDARRVRTLAEFERAARKVWYAGP